MKIVSLVAAGAVALVSMPLAAQSAEALKAATAVVDATSPPDRARAQLEQQLTQMRSGNGMRTMLSQNPRFRQEAAKNQPAFNSALARMGALQADALGPIQREMLGASRQEAIATFARNFTVDELNAIAAFYRTPAGAKLPARQPQMNAEIGKAMQTRFGPRVQAAEKGAAPRIEAELRKLFPPQAGGK